jgi:hypothetical protein
MQRGESLVVPRIYICAIVEQYLDNLEALILLGAKGARYYVQRSHPPVSLYIYIGPVLDQSLNCFGVCVRGRQVQRGPSALPTGIHIRAVIEQPSHGLDRSGRTCRSQWCVVVDAPDIDIGTMSPKQFRHFEMFPMQRGHQWGHHSTTASIYVFWMLANEVFGQIMEPTECGVV